MKRLPKGGSNSPTSGYNRTVKPETAAEMMRRLPFGKSTSNRCVEGHEDRRAADPAVPGPGGELLQALLRHGGGQLSRTHRGRDNPLPAETDGADWGGERLSQHLPYNAAPNVGRGLAPAGQVRYAICCVGCGYAKPLVRRRGRAPALHWVRRKTILSAAVFEGGI